MIGAIAGDIIGSVYERHPIKTTDFPLFQSKCRFTDDSVLTVAVASAILEHMDYTTVLKTFGRKYPNRGYGHAFKDWIEATESHPYQSWGNGAAMRVSPIGFACSDVEHVLNEAQRSAEVSHNHPEGIKGAQATALALFLAHHGESKEHIRREIMRRFGYNFQRTIETIRPKYHFDASCQGTVPEAIIAFLDAENYVETIRNAISLGGDSDTLACIAGGIAEAFYHEIPDDIIRTVISLLPEEFVLIIKKFNMTYGLLYPSIKREIPKTVLSQLEKYFHKVILSRAGNLVTEQSLTLPTLESLLAEDHKETKEWFAIPGMYGGFAYWLEGGGMTTTLVTESWSRVIGGSGQRHEITVKGIKLVEEGFV